MAEKPKSTGAPKWMTTFADMSTLLMTFFVLLLSMANIDIAKFREMLGSVEQAFGVSHQSHGNYQATGEDNEKVGVVEKQNTPQQAATSAAKDFDYESEVANAVVQADALEQTRQEQAVAEIKRTIEETEIGNMAEIQSGKNGIRVRVKGALLFDEGASLLRPEAKPFLDDLVAVLKKFD
jgi:chemotaxis protein MotB